MTEHALNSASSSLLAAQLASDIESVKLAQENSADRLRPILTHLNADTSWLLSLPVPKGCDAGEGKEGRKYIHMVFDPWFTGTQTDGYWWFSTQWHMEESRYQSLGEVEELIRSIEGLPSRAETSPVKPDSTDDVEGQSTKGDGDANSLIDAIIVSHEFTDHMHEATLKSAHPSVPIFAPKGKAIELLHTWNHFNTVIPIALTPSPKEEPDWRNWCSEQKDIEGLEWTEWCKITRLMAPEKSMIGYHEGVLFTYPQPTTPPTQFTNFPVPAADAAAVKSDLESGLGEAIIYTPHGLPPSAVQPLSTNKNIRTLALLHGEHDIRLAGNQLNLGERNGKEVVKETKAKYWCATHDEVKHGSGVVSWFLSRTLGKGKQVVEGKRAEEMERELGGETACRTVENGGRLVLE